MQQRRDGVSVLSNNGDPAPGRLGHRRSRRHRLQWLERFRTVVHSRGRLSQARLEPKPVANRVALPVVVEVGVDVDARGATGRCRRAHVVELPLGVVAGAAAAAVVEADERPVRRQLVRLEGPLRMVADDERRAVLAQEPRRRRARTSSGAGTRSSAGPAEAARARRPRRSSSRWKFAGSCQSTGPSFGESTSGCDALVEALDALLQVGQALDVGEEAARLDGEEETRRRRLRPSAATAFFLGSR